MDVNSLRSQVAELEAQLEEKENVAYKAAELGKKLLESNQDLENQLDETTKSYSERIESLEQEKFSLQQKLEVQKSTADAIQHDFDNTCAQLDTLEQKYSQQLKYAEEVHSQKLHEQTKIVNDLKAEIEKLEVQVKTGVEKAKLQEKTIEQLHEDINGRGNTSLLQHELKDLQQLYTDEKARSEELHLLVVESEGNTEMLSVEVAALQEKVASLEEECQDRCRMANEWYDALKESKEQNAELNCQLEALKLETMGEGHHRKGNSLFGEVDDRRMEMERKLISLKVRYEAIEKSHSTAQHQLRKMKADMSALLCQYGATSADAAHTQRLQRALAQCKSENQSLLSKIHRLEKQQAEGGGAQQHRKCVSAFVDFGNKTEYIQFLEQELEQVKASHSSVIKELDLKRTQLLWESNKLSEAETKIHRTEQEIALLKKEFTKIKMKQQENLEKLAEADVQNKQLLAEKAYLEEELKSRGNKRKSNMAGNSQQRQTSETLWDGSTSLLNTSQSVSCSEKGSKKSIDNSFAQGGGGYGLDNSKIVRTTIVKREINILDDLEKEFNKQRQREKEPGSWPPTVKETGRVSWTGKEEERRSRNTSSSSDSKSDIENMERGVACSADSTHSSQRTAVPAKVIRVNSNEKVNECPQQ